MTHEDAKASQLVAAAEDIAKQGPDVADQAEDFLVEYNAQNNPNRYDEFTQGLYDKRADFDYAATKYQKAKRQAVKIQPDHSKLSPVEEQALAELDEDPEGSWF